VNGSLTQDGLCGGHVAGEHSETRVSGTITRVNLLTICRVVCLYTLQFRLTVGWSETDWSCGIEQSIFLLSSLVETCMHMCANYVGIGSDNMSKDVVASFSQRDRSKIRNSPPKLALESRRSEPAIPNTNQECHQSIRCIFYVQTDFLSTDCLWLCQATPSA
jgi:hypothetical protein